MPVSPSTGPILLIPEYSERDRRYVEQAVSKAKRKNPALSGSIFEFLKSVLLLDYPDDFEGSDKMEWVDFAMRFQQVTGPVMAKGLEDTVFYVYNRLVSLNEVGGNPEEFGTTLDAFRAQNVETAKSRPHSLITTSTHDTKRSEDVRARINVLSEIPEEWRRVRYAMEQTQQQEKAGDRWSKRFLIVTRNTCFIRRFLGVWPAHPVTGADHEALKARIRDYMVKAIREAKVNSSWMNPDGPYEKALLKFIDTIFSRSAANLFMKDFLPFQKKISYFGMFNSLSQTLLKITSPGVPDFYQGTEIWDFSLVDPDNRRPVNFDTRRRMLKGLKKRMAERGRPGAL